MVDKPKNSMLKPKSRKKVKRPREIHSHSIYGHSHYLYFTHKSWVDKTYRKTNLIGPKKMLVPKDKIIYVVDTLSSKYETPFMVTGKWMLFTHKGNKAYIPIFET